MQKCSTKYQHTESSNIYKGLYTTANRDFPSSNARLMYHPKLNKYTILIKDKGKNWINRKTTYKSQHPFIVILNILAMEQYFLSLIKNI